MTSVALKPRRIKESTGDRLFSIVNYLLLTAFVITVLYPLVYIVSASFSDATAVVSGQVWLWPVKPTLDGYRAVFNDSEIVSGFLNSLFYTVVGTAVNVILTILAGYPLSRKDLFGRNVLTFLFVFTMLFSGGMIPTYLVVKDLGLLNTRWALIIPTALSAYNVIITRTYFQMNLPDELLEAAQIDGANDFTFLWRIVLPLSGPIIAVNALFYAVGHWNEFFNALIYLTDQSLFPLQLVLREILIQNQVDLSKITDVQKYLEMQNLANLLKYALIVVSTVPVLVVYPFVQKHFVKGIMIGSLKG
jgi:multiple sugar transport system permease protein/putative aldouronate transport system permease protein